MKKIWNLKITLLILAGLALAACTLPGTGGDPTATIIAPASGTSVPVGQLVTVEAQGNDPDGPGIIRLDLQVDGVTVDTFTAGGPQNPATAQLTFTPDSEGAITVGVIAFRQDGTASAAATIALQVVGAGQAPQTTEGQSQPAGGTSQGINATAKTNMNLRAGASPNCVMLGTWPTGQSGMLVARIDNTDGSGYWYKTTFLGNGVVAYVFAGQNGENLTLDTPDDSLPREQARGCLAEGGSASSSSDPTGADGTLCGDGICQSGESPTWCGDCTPTSACGNSTVDAGEVCDGSLGCPAGQTCSSDCSACSAPAVCGNGSVDTGEACDGATGCAAGQVCATDCSACNAPTCGDNIVNQPQELCDGTAGCFAGSTCAPDCSQCLVAPPPSCGDANVQPPEQCDPPTGGTGTCTPALAGQQICDSACMFTTCP